MPPNGPDCWPKQDSNKQWLVFYRLDDMTFTGIGTIEGNGEQWWELPCKPHKVFLHNYTYLVQKCNTKMYLMNQEMRFQGPNGSTLPGPCDSPAVS